MLKHKLVDFIIQWAPGLVPAGMIADIISVRQGSWKK